MFTGLGSTLAAPTDAAADAAPLLALLAMRAARRERWNVSFSVVVVVAGEDVPPRVVVVAAAAAVVVVAVFVDRTIDDADAP